MDENSELEEGEACFYEDEDDNINPDTAFSYISELQDAYNSWLVVPVVDVLQSGAKFGGYGSFLPTYERSPPRLSRPKTPQRNSSANNFSTEGASHNLKAPPNAPPIGRPGNISWPSGNIAAKHCTHLTSAQVAKKSALKDESFNRTGIPSDQKTLKVMISNHVPGGVLISPLHDSLLCLLRKEMEIPSKENKPIPLLKACQEHPSMLIDESVLGYRKQLNEKKTKVLIGKREELLESNHGNCMKVESGKTLHVKKKPETEIAGGESLPNDLRHTAPSSSDNIAMEATARACDVSAEANQNALRGRLFSSDSAKEDSLESITGRSRSSGKKKKRDKWSSLDKKDWEQSVDNSNKNASLDLGDNVGSKCYQKCTPSKLEEDSKTKVGQIATFREQNKISIPSKKEKTLFEGKKSKGSKNTGEVADSMKESLRPDVGASVTLKDTISSSQGFSSGKEKNRKLKLQKGINKGQDNHRDAMETNSEQKSGKMEQTMRHFQNRTKNYGPMDFEEEHNGHLDKSKVKFSGRIVDNQLSGVDAPDVVPHLNDKRHASQTAATAPVALSVQGKKNHGLKEVQKAGSSGLNQMLNSNKKQQKESLKSKSLNDMTQAPVESIVMKKSTFEEKERLLVGGETKKAKMKNKRESGPYAYEGSKKRKAEVEYATGKRNSSNLDHRRVGLNSSTGLPTQANGRSVQNYNGPPNSGDIKHDIKEKSVASVKKLVDQTQTSSDGRSLDMRICDKRAPVKKRKLEDWQDSQNGNESSMKEESSESGSRNGKKLRFSKIEGKQFNRNDGDGPLNRKSMDHLIGGIEEVRCIDMNQKLNSICKISIRCKPSSRLGNSHVHNGDSHSAENAQHTVECSHSEDRLNKDCGGNALFSQNSKKVSTSQRKENKRSSADKMKCSEDEKNYSGRKNPSGQPASDSRMGTQSNLNHAEVDVKSAAPCSNKGNNATEHNVIQDFSGQTKVTQIEVRSGMPKSSLCSETESWQEKKGHRTVSEAEQGVVSDGVPVNGSSSVDALKALNQPGKTSGKNSCSPVRENSSSLMVTNALNDAKGLRNYADRLKSSGFVFESNEIYFQAALKFLGVAALLETSNSESGGHGDMNQMQVYSTATKLCEMCAQEYEKCQEMAAAALAYKCVEATQAIRRSG
ncbi:hypothetical protein V6N13_065229 [Hibiscus sabdariffa]